MNNATCNNTATSEYSKHIHQFAYVVYNIVTPLFAIFALIGQSLLLFVLVKRFKSERTAYECQVYCASAEAAAVVIKIFYFVGISTDPVIIGGSEYRTSFQDHLSSCYTCVWYSARLGRAMAASMCTLCLLLSTMMAADRVMGLAKPMAYKNANHKMRRRCGLIVCILLSFLASAVDVGRAYVTKTDDGDNKYAMTIDVIYINRPFVRVLALVRVTLQASALVTLASLSVVLCYLYRTRVSNQKAKISDRSAHELAKRNETILFTLTLFQCVHSVSYMTMGLSITAFNYCFPTLYACWRPVTDTSVDLARMLLDLCNIYGVMLVSKKVREVIKTAFSCGVVKRKESTANKVGDLRMNDREKLHAGLA